jgi:hypothetical protein
MTQLAKYVRGSNRTPEQQDEIYKRIGELYALEQRFKNERLRLQSIVDNDVSMVHVGVVLEIDRELLALEPDCYGIKVRNLSSNKVEYVTKAQLRK